MSPNEKWALRTMRDNNANRASQATDNTAGGADNYPVHVSCGCGRMVAPDMMTDVSVFTPAERQAKGWAQDTLYICDACRSLAILTGTLALSDLYTRQGAPADVMARVHAHEQANSVANSNRNRRP
ncbi:MAG: hypothetical protein ACR2M1_14560 [Gemmatimonadaceae bacterium]